MKSLAFKICFTICLLGGAILLWVDQAKPGIIAFELARTIENGNSMVAQWEAVNAIPFKKFSLYFDYLFIIGYAGSLYILLREWYQRTGKSWIKTFSYVPIVAGVLDGVENLGLLQIIYNQGTQFSASLAFYCASVKFIILLPSILLTLYYLVQKYSLSRSSRPVKS
jgi:hypothetical protein